MFTITIDEKNVRNSILVFNNEKKSIAELPCKLRKQVMKMLYILRNHHYSKVSSNGKEVCFQPKKSFWEVDLSEPGSFLKFWSLFLETAQLLNWYLGPHFHTADNEIICCVCGKPQISQYLGEQCQSVPCPSHEKWEMVIDDYITPTKRIKELMKSGALKWS